MEDYALQMEDADSEPSSGTNSTSGSCPCIAELLQRPASATASRLSLFGETMQQLSATEVCALDYLKMPSPLCELEEKLEQFWAQYEPDEDDSSSSEFEIKSSSTDIKQRDAERGVGEGEGERGEAAGVEQVSAGARGRMRLVEGARSQHTQVPEWVFLARSYPRLFHRALASYLRHLRWPPMHNLPLWFQRKCSARGVGAASVRQSPRGFAPVWLLLLRELCESGAVEGEWLGRCVDAFFDDGRFPPLDSLPAALQALCQRLRVGPDHFYELSEDESADGGVQGAVEVEVAKAAAGALAAEAEGAAHGDTSGLDESGRSL